ncbi:MAG TPA: helix-turn-helix domain-containing protein [Thermoleophilaceae bacterium]|nr:helix-turn-helix domain-containing protein [Thermoleophilaceae bacterium]
MSRTEPWRALPAEVADLIEPELETTTDEILATIAREVPDYARPLEGAFGRNVRTGVSEALRQFVELIRSPSGERGSGREVYVGLGGAELREGRTLDALQSAYRVGARVAWRRLAAAATRAGVEPEVLSLLAESIFAYIEELSADSVEGYADARSRREGERRRRRGELVTLLVREPPAAEPDLRAVAEAAGWRVPRTAAALACHEERLERLGGRLPIDAVTAVVDGIGCAIVPDPDGPGRRSELDLAVEASKTRAALGPSGALGALSASWSLARATLRAVEAGAIEAPALVRVEDALTELLLFENGPLVERLAVRRLAAFDALTPKARRRMEETALAYVQQQGNAAAMSRALGLHAQTARYRLSRLRELLGDSLDEPDARFELELALRARCARG